jgi:hypothetical protein
MNGPALPDNAPDFPSPREFLWKQQSFASDGLRKVGAWLLDQEGAAGPHPFSKPEETLQSWALACRNAGTPVSLRDALEINPADPEALALYGAALAKSARAGSSYGAIMAAFFHARRLAPDSSDICNLEAEAMQQLAAAMLAAGEPFRAEAAIKAAGLGEDVLREERRKAHEAAAAALPGPAPEAQAE